MPFTIATPAGTDVLLIVGAIEADEPVRATYTDRDGVQSVRYFTPRVIERGDNGETFVRVWDHQRRAPRTFTLARITNVGPAF